MNAVNLTYLMTGLLFVTFCEGTDGRLDCYVCSSNNGSDPRCGDPFHPARLNLTRNCRQGRENRIGLFPARYCTKITGKTSDGIERIIRSCAFETLDNMCGMFRLEEVTYTGCIESCNEDACNASERLKSPVFAVFLALLIRALICSYSR